MEFGPYRLDELLGRGGMGEVFRAHDRRHDRTVAVKRLAPHLADEPEFQQRFRREAQLVAQLRNPHVITIHSYGEIDDQLYIDMQYVGGGDLLGLIERAGPLSPQRAVGVLEQVASALDEAHAGGLVHRDVKPSNVLLDAKLADFCYLADWGITRVTTTRRSHSLTRTGALLGSLTYMAPEQFDGAVTTRSDIYALTCVFFEMITGRRPYDGDGLPALMHAHMKIPPPRPSQVTASAAMFDEIIEMGMAKDAEARYATAGDLARAARQALIDSPEPRRAVAPGVHSAETADHDIAGLPGPFAAAAVGTPPGADVAAAPRVDRPRGRGPRLLPAAVAVLGIAVLVAVWGLTRTGESSTQAQASPGATTSAATPASAATSTSAATPTSSAAPPSSAPAAGPVLAEAVFTGRTSDNDLTLAVGIKDGRAAGYLCDGDQVEAWLAGTVEGDRLVLTGRDPANTVVATVDQRSLGGEITVDGVERPFSAAIAVGAAGLYENRRAVEGISTRIGWIVLPTGEQVGIAARGDVRAPAPPLDLQSLTAIDGGETVVAVRLSGDSDVL